MSFRGPGAQQSDLLGSVLCAARRREMLPAWPRTREGDLFGKSFSCGVSGRRMACCLALIRLPAGSFLGGLLAWRLLCAMVGLLSFETVPVLGFGFGRPGSSASLNSERRGGDDACGAPEKPGSI